MNDGFHFERHPDGASMAFAAAHAFAELATERARERGYFRVALAGGTTPHALYSVLADLTVPAMAGIPWENIHLWWGDERYVPSDSPDSNFRMVFESLLDPLPIPVSNIYRLHTEEAAPQAVARHYAQRMRDAAQAHGCEPGYFDLLLLGMGDDGHTASLFPHTAAVQEADETFVANWVPQLDSWRFTITPPVLKQAQEAWVLVTGTKKAAMLKQVVEGPVEIEERPAQILRGRRGPTRWWLDAAAAAELSAE